MATNRRLVGVGSDFYPTPIWATQALLKAVKFDGNILEPCCGDGAISKVFLDAGFAVQSSDKYYRDYGVVEDAFDLQGTYLNVVTNPPFSLAEELFHHFYPKTRHKLCFLLRTAFLEGSERYRTIFSKHPPEEVHIFSERVTMFPKNSENKTGGTTSYAWFVWDKQLLHSHKDAIPKIRWIEPGLKPGSRYK